MPILATFHPRNGYGLSIHYTVEDEHLSIKKIQDANKNDVHEDWTQDDVNAVFDVIVL
jgi:hypothetical protein